MASLPSAYLFSFSLLALVLTVALALPAANGCLAYLGLSAAPGSWPRNTALAVPGLILATIFHPLPPGSDQLYILIAFCALSAIPRAVASWLYFPVPWFSNSPSPPKEDENDSNMSAAARRNQRSAQATDKPKFDKIIVKLEKDILALKTALTAIQQQPVVTVTGDKGMDWLTSINGNFKEVALTAVHGLSITRRSPPWIDLQAWDPPGRKHERVQLSISGLGRDGKTAPPPPSPHPAGCPSLRPIPPLRRTRRGPRPARRARSGEARRSRG